MRIRTAAVATTAVAGALAAPAVIPAQATEYTALKARGIQYDAPGSDSHRCSTGNTDEEYLTIRNYSSSKTVNLRGYVSFHK